MQSDSRPSPRETPAPRRGLQNLKPVAPSLVPHTRARDARDARCARARCLRVISVAWTRARCERDDARARAPCRVASRRGAPGLERRDAR